MLRTVLLTKPGYRQGGFSRGLLLIKLALDTVIRQRIVRGLPSRIYETAGDNGKHTKRGAHYGPRWEAVDIRTKDWAVTLETKVEFMQAVLERLNDGPVTMSQNSKGWWVAKTRRNVAILEYLGREDEHAHFQVRKGHTIT